MPFCIISSRQSDATTDIVKCCLPVGHESA